MDALALGRNTGRGACGNGGPRGVSRQMRQALISDTRRASTRSSLRESGTL
jgi:hypothetical protein